MNETSEMKVDWEASPCWLSIQNWIAWQTTATEPQIIPLSRTSINLFICSSVKDAYNNSELDG
jgi:hypothetical protein